MTPSQDACALPRQHARSADKPYITTFNGIPIKVPGLRRNMINLDDITRSLSMQVRYLGHLTKFYSIAEHLVLVTEMARFKGEDIVTQAMCLCHDFQEAYVGDFPSPFKSAVVGLRQFEDGVEAVIRDAFNLPDNDDPRWQRVKLYDQLALHYEGARLFKTSPMWVDPAFVSTHLEGYMGWDLGWEWRDAETAFRGMLEDYDIRSMLR